MATAQVRIEGLRDTIRSLELVGVEAGEFRQSMSLIAGRIAALAAQEAPYATGALQKRVKGSRSKNVARVYIRSGLRYDRFVYYGSGRGHRGKPYIKFIEKAANENEQWIRFRIDAELDQIIVRAGF